MPNYIMRDATDHELEAMVKYAEELADHVLEEREYQRKKEVERPCEAGGKHQWWRDVPRPNKLIRGCEKCGVVKIKYYTNEELRYMEKHIAEIAQPGTKLWHKVYGDRTPEQVMAMYQ